MKMKGVVSLRILGKCRKIPQFWVNLLQIGHICAKFGTFMAIFAQNEDNLKAIDASKNVEFGAFGA